MKLTKSKRAAAKVLIVDDHPAVREALSIRIGRAPDLKVCGEAADTADALRLVEDVRPDVAVIDIALKTGNGIDLIKRIKARDDHVRILVWSMYGESLYAERALRAGAMGYITKQEATDQILEALRRVVAGKVYLSAAMTDRLLNYAVGEGPQRVTFSPVDALSDRELEVLRSIGQGWKTGEIAAQLHLSIKTIETYRDRIRHKLELKDGTDMARFAMQWVLENG
jgi:DNA-binding NarL/FixJ family response regulator